MIKNDKQHTITQNRRDEFLQSLDLFMKSDKENLLNQIMIESIKSQIETFERELNEYEKLKNEKPCIIISTIEQLPETLIKARIAKGLSQNELAKKAGLKEQQIQRYETTNYESANFERILSIAKSMGVHFEDTKAILFKDLITVNGYDPSFLIQATNKLQSKKSLLAIQ